MGDAIKIRPEMVACVLFSKLDREENEEVKSLNTEVRITDDVNDTNRLTRYTH